MTRAVGHLAIWIFALTVIACDPESKLDSSITAQTSSDVAAADSGPARVHGTLPDFGELRPFADRDPSLDPQLREVLLRAEARSGGCLSDTVILPDPSDFQLCDRNDVAMLGTVLASMAPSLDPAGLEDFFIVHLDADAEPDLIVSYEMGFCSEFDRVISGCFHYDNFSAYFLFRRAVGGYQVSASGNFAGGTLHAVTPFGVGSLQKKLIFRHQSCFACEPWILLSVVDFADDPDGTAFEFTYAVDHETWNTDIEYGLPGMGHSVEATTDTRMPTRHDPDGPHLMQFFDLEERADEWWLFRCRDYRCDYELFENTLPTEYQAIWDGALRL